MPIFDSHAHYDDSAFDEDRDTLLASLPGKQVTEVLNCASNLKSAHACIEMAVRYACCYAAVGVHPHDAKDAPGDVIDQLRRMLAQDKVVAVGEIGLDYHYDFSPREVQKQLFEAQLKLAQETDRPVIVHDREAHADTLALLRQYRPKGVVHCFSGSVEMMRDLVALGMCIGLGGAVTFKNAKMPLAVAAEVPADRLLIETDAPYMAPVPFRGKRCDSTLIPHTAQVIADCRGMTAEAVLELTRENARRLFLS